MEIRPEIVQTLLFIIAALGGGLFVGGLAERILLGRLQRLNKPGAPWKIWRGIGWLTGAWVGLRIVLEQVLLSEHWTQQAWVGWKILGVLIAMVYLGRLTGRLVQETTSEMAGALPAVSLLHYVAKGVVYVSGVLIILQAMGISITPMLTALGVGGLAVALALQDTLSNLFSGMQIIASSRGSSFGWKAARKVRSRISPGEIPRC
jgi:small-conductance mechanosensitive channel